MSDLSDAVKSGVTTDPHWDINGQVTGASCVSARLGHGHLNLYIDSRQVEIPDPNVKLSDTKYGIVASTL